jgi:hypothetical protein
VQLECLQLLLCEAQFKLAALVICANRLYFVQHVDCVLCEAPYKLGGGGGEGGEGEGEGGRGRAKLI